MTRSLPSHLMVMDSTATSLSMDNHIPIILFALKDPENILRVVMGEKIGTDSEGGQHNMVDFKDYTYKMDKHARGAPGGLRRRPRRPCQCPRA